MFDRTEWLSNIQIQGFFSRLCLKQRSKIQQESDDATDADDHLIEASASDVDEGCIREARNTVIDEIGLKHPIMFDIDDVCSLAREARLPSLKCDDSVFRPKTGKLNLRDGTKQLGEITL